MTWSVSASGTKEQVKEKIAEQVGPSHPECVEPLQKMVDSLTAANGASISGSGSNSGFSLSGTAVSV